MNFLIHWVIVAAALLVVPYIVPGFQIGGFGTALVAAAVLGAVNLLIKPILTLITLPINVLTLGLFSLVINALMLKLAAGLVPGFAIQGFWPALVGGIVLALVNMAFGMVWEKTHHHEPAHALR
jgi:putative membrane protein